MLCLCGTPYAYNARRGQKGASDPLTLEIQRAVTHHVGSQNQIEAGPLGEQSQPAAPLLLSNGPDTPAACFLTPSPTHSVIFLLDLFGMEGSNRVAGASHKNPRAGREDFPEAPGRILPGECRAPKATPECMSRAGLAPSREHVALALMLLNLWEQGTSLVPRESSLR